MGSESRKGGGGWGIRDAFPFSRRGGGFETRLGRHATQASRRFPVCTYTVDNTRTRNQLGKKIFSRFLLTEDVVHEGGLAAALRPHDGHHLVLPVPFVGAELVEVLAQSVLGKLPVVRHELVPPHRRHLRRSEEADDTGDVDGQLLVAFLVFFVFFVLFFF